MPDIQNILTVHRQLFPDSCAASGMELVLKLHDEEDADWFDFQNKFGNQNIGFEQLELLTKYGIKASDAHLPKDELVKFLTDEVQAGRFPLVSFPRFWMHSLITGGAGFSHFHIWVAIPHEKSFLLVAGGNGTSGPEVIQDFDAMMQRIHHYERDYLIHHVRYTIKP